MQLRKMTLMLAALGAVGMMLTACGGEGRESLTCSTDADCLENEICHPDAKVCVQTCTTSSDCPNSAKECSALGGSSSMKDSLICKCSTDQLCQGDTRVSDASALVCLSGSSVCGPKGTTPACTKDTDCASGQVCDTTSGTCKASTVGNACTGEGQSICTYGEFCSSSKCAAVPAPTCENYQNFTARDQLGKTGPIIFKAVTTSAALDGFCPSSAPKRVKVTVSAYSSTPFPQTKDELNGMFWVNVSGTPASATALISSSAGNYTVTGTNRERADIVLSYCVASSSTTLSTAFYFTNGNFFCHQASY